MEKLAQMDLQTLEQQLTTGTTVLFFTPGLPVYQACNAGN